MLTILSVAYPFAPVGPDAVGGAEQVLSHLDAALVGAGHRSIVVACEGSATSGELVATHYHGGSVTAKVRERAWAEHRRAIRRALDRYEVDLIHAHGLDFHRYLPPPFVPVLATLHLPPGWYPGRVFRMTRPVSYLNCVSLGQQLTCPPGAPLVPAISNGVPVRALQARHAKRNFALMLGRICPEKGFHIGIDAARRAGIPVVLGGAVFPYPDHQQYFDRELAPRFGEDCRFVGPLSFARKRQLLSAARCLLVPSQAPETSSLVAMEALACGTPVIAFPIGALPEVIEDGRTGFLVNDAREMSDAIRRVDRLDPEECREVARERFSVEVMARRYLALYLELVAMDGRGDRGHATAA